MNDMGARRSGRGWPQFFRQRFARLRSSAADLFRLVPQHSSLALTPGARHAGRLLRRWLGLHVDPEFGDHRFQFFPVVFARVLLAPIATAWRRSASADFQSAAGARLG